MFEAPTGSGILLVFLGPAIGPTTHSGEQTAQRGNTVLTSEQLLREWLVTRAARLDQGQGTGEDRHLAGPHPGEILVRRQLAAGPGVGEKSACMAALGEQY